MLEMKVRLGLAPLDPIGYSPLPGVVEVLRDLRQLFFEAAPGIVDVVEKIELEVDTGPNFWDENIEPMKITIVIEDSPLSRGNHATWRRSFAAKLCALIRDSKGALDAVPTFQVIIVVGAHHSGSVYNSATGEEATKPWIDYPLLLKEDRPHYFRDRDLDEPVETYAGQRFGLPDPWD